jgi:hypothetical protein
MTPGASKAKHCRQPAYFQIFIPRDESKPWHPSRPAKKSNRGPETVQENPMQALAAYGVMRIQ